MEWVDLTKRRPLLANTHMSWKPLKLTIIVGLGFRNSTESQVLTLHQTRKVAQVRVTRDRAKWCILTRYFWSTFSSTDFWIGILHKKVLLKPLYVTISFKGINGWLLKNLEKSITEIETFQFSMPYLRWKHLYRSLLYFTNVRNLASMSQLQKKLSFPYASSYENDLVNDFFVNYNEKN